LTCGGISVTALLSIVLQGLPVPALLEDRHKALSIDWVVAPECYTGWYDGFDFLLSVKTL